MLSVINLKGFHKNVRNGKASGAAQFRHYAWRGGPCIGLTAEPIGVNGRPIPEDILVKLIAARNGLSAALPVTKAGPTIANLIADWQKSADYAAIRPATARMYEGYLPRILAKFGDMPLAAAEHPAARADFLAFRDECAFNWVREAGDTKGAHTGAEPPAKPKPGAAWLKPMGPGKVQRHAWKATPRAADAALMTLGVVLNWGVDRRKLTANQAAKPGRLAKADRSAIVWDADALGKLKAVASAEVWNAVALAALTGLSQIDLLNLKWSEVYLDSGVIELAGGRTKTGADTMPPILPEARAILESLLPVNEAGERIAPDPAAHVLVNSRGAAWTSDGFRASLRAAMEAGGVDKKLHFHDLRGTAATQFAIATDPATGQAYSMPQIGLFMGWTASQVETIVRKYVNVRNVAKGVRNLFAGLGGGAGNVVALAGAKRKTG